MSVGSLCSRPAVTVAMGAPIADVARLMQDRHVGAVVVTENGRDGPRAAGVITDRDIVSAQLAHSADLSRLAAGDVMTPDPLVLGEEEPVDGAIAHLRARGVRRAPVVSRDGTLVGLVSVDDLLAHLAHELIAMAQIIARQQRAEHD
jgi:CBS domain-containing protein